MDPALVELQLYWYSRLATEGFIDIEDTSDPERPLIQWTGFNRKYWPEGAFAMQEELLHHPELPMVCESICRHGNHSLASYQIKKILELHIHGMSCREIGRELGIVYVTVFRVQKKLNEWATLIESRDE